MYFFFFFGKNPSARETYLAEFLSSGNSNLYDFLTTNAHILAQTCIPAAAEFAYCCINRRNFSHQAILASLISAFSSAGF
jgi:hypothetical protein